MIDRKIYVLISGYKDIKFSGNIETELVTASYLSSKNPNDYNLIFVRDLSDLNALSIRTFFNRVSQAKLLLFLPSQWKLSESLHPSRFLMSYSKGIHPVISGTEWLAKEIQSRSPDISLSYEAEFSPSQNTASTIALEEVLNKLEKEPKSGPYSVIATNPAEKVVSFIFRGYGNSTLIVYPFMSGPENKLQEFIKKIIEKAITTEIGIEMSRKAPSWIQKVFPEKRKELHNIVKQYESVSSFINLAEGLYYQTGEDLEETVGKVLEYMEIKVEFVGHERGQRDLLIEFSNGKRLITEVKGLKGQADFRHISNFLAGNPSEDELSFVVNNDLDVPISDREDSDQYPPFHPNAIKLIKENIRNGKVKAFYPLTTVELAKWASERIKNLDLLKKMEESRDKILGKQQLTTGGLLRGTIVVDHESKVAPKEEKEEE